MIEEGQSPAQEKQREKRRLSAMDTFAEAGKRWFKDARMGDSTHSMRKAIYDRDTTNSDRYRRSQRRSGSLNALRQGVMLANRGR
jgi:hypothetical protein